MHTKMLSAKDLSAENILIIAPHPDDETIGCGGLIARLCAQGHAPHVAILTGGGGSHRGCCDTAEEKVMVNRHQLTLNSARVLGLPESHIHTFDFKDGSIADRPTAEIDRLKQLISEIRPEAILVPHSGEGWPDHLAARQIGIDIAPEDMEIYEYCVWMWYYNVWRLDWKNACKLKMTPNEHKAKLAAMYEYILPTAPCGKPWSGVLPKTFIRANSHNTELYFRLR